MHLSEVFRNLVLQQAATLTGSKPTGRPRTLSDEDALRGIFRVLRTFMQWRELDAIPGEVHYTTVFRRFRTWGSAHVFEIAYTRALQTYRRLRRVQHYTCPFFISMFLCVFLFFFSNVFRFYDYTVCTNTHTQTLTPMYGRHTHTHTQDKYATPYTLVNVKSVTLV